MRQLLPVPLDDVDLRAAYAYPSTGQPSTAWVRANMVSSVDGAAVVNGRSEDLSSDADQQIFGVLRGLADAVVVGAGTARIEGYRALRAKEAFGPLRTALGQRPAPVLVIVSARLDLDPASKLFHDGGEPTIVVTPASSPADRRTALAEVADVIVAGDAKVDPAVAIEMLARRGLTRVLCEGGPTLLAAIAAAGCLHELCLTVAPRLVGGDARRILRGPPVDATLELGHLLEQDGTLFPRYVRPRPR